MKNGKELKIIVSSDGIEYQLHKVSLRRGEKKVDLGYVPVKHDLLTELGIEENVTMAEFDNSKHIERTLQKQLAIGYQASVRAQFNSDKWNDKTAFMFMAKLDIETLKSVAGDLDKMRSAAKTLWESGKSENDAKSTPNKIWWFVLGCVSDNTTVTGPNWGDEKTSETNDMDKERAIDRATDDIIYGTDDNE